MNFADIRKRIESTHIEYGHITDIAWVEEGQSMAVPGLPVGSAPEHIKVSVTCKPETGSNIRIAVWLPTRDWNGEFMGTGNGGAAGALLPFAMVGPLKLGFAVANTDMGTSAGPDCGIGNQAVWKDFGYRATHLMTAAAKAIIKSCYGILPKYSYFSGCSTGGQQALMEVQRYPEDYDGILAPLLTTERICIWDFCGIGLLLTPGKRECSVLKMR